LPLLEETAASLGLRLQFMQIILETVAVNRNAWHVFAQISSPM